MKTMQVPFCFYPDPGGGTEVYVESLAHRLQARGLSVVVAAPGRQSCSYEHRGLPVRRFSVADRVEALENLYGDGDARAAREFGDILDDERPDILHMHAFTRGVSLRLVREAKARGIGVVFTYHTPTVSCQRGTLMRWGTEVCNGTLDLTTCTACALHGLGVLKPVAHILGRMPQVVDTMVGRGGISGGGWTALRMRGLMARRHAAVRALFEEADEVVAVSQWVRNLLLRNGVPARKIHLSRHGASQAPVVPSDGLRGTERGPLRIAFLGRLDRTKGPDILVRAMRTLRGRLVRIDLYGIAQSDAENTYVAELKRLAGGDTRIRFLPAVSHECVATLLRAYDLVGVPSRWLETGPLVVLEAFAAGVPVVGSKLGGIAELVRDGVDGILVESDSAEVWARTIQQLDTHRDVLERLRRAIQPPRTMDDVADDMLTIYRGLPQNSLSWT